MVHDTVMVYWDASAILSALFRDTHSEVALRYAEQPGLHICSSLAFAEVQAVIARIQQQALLADVLVAAAREAFASSPWRLLTTAPDPQEVERLAKRWPLKGADLWHLAAASTLRGELPNLRLLTFDEDLQTAADGEGLGRRG